MIVLIHSKPVEKGVLIRLSCTTCCSSDTFLLSFNESLQRFYLCKTCFEVTFVRPSGFSSDFCTFKSDFDSTKDQTRKQLNRFQLGQQAKRGSIVL